MKFVLTTLSLVIGAVAASSVWVAGSDSARASASSVEEKVDEIIESKTAEQRAAGTSEKVAPSSTPAESWMSGCTPKGTGTERNAQACSMSETAKRTLPPSTK